MIANRFEEMATRRSSLGEWCVTTGKIRKFDGVDGESSVNEGGLERASPEYVASSEVGAW